jgi:hypothetical protein
MRVISTVKKKPGKGEQNSLTESKFLKVPSTHHLGLRPVRPLLHPLTVLYHSVR